MYIGDHSTEITYKTANISLLAAKEKGQRDQSTWEMQYGSTADQLKMYNVTTGKFLFFTFLENPFFANFILL